MIILGEKIYSLVLSATIFLGSYFGPINGKKYIEIFLPYPNSWNKESKNNPKTNVKKSKLYFVIRVPRDVLNLFLPESKN